MTTTPRPLWATRWIWILVGACALGAALWPGAGYAQAPDAVGSPVTSEDAFLLNAAPPPVPPFVPGVVLVGIEEELAAAAAPFGEMNVAAVETLDVRGLDGEQGTGGVTGLRLQVPPGEEWATVERLEQQPGVVFAELDWLAHTAQAQSAAVETPYQVADTLYAEQWYLQRVHMSRAWALAEDAQLGPGALAPVRVAVIDTGVDYDHPDLAGRLLPGRNYVSPVPGPTPALDDNGHGTHITGLIGALVGDGDGMAGTALDVELEPLKVLGGPDGEGPISGVAQAIRDAADSGAQIINLSLEIPIDNTVVRSAVNYAANKGVLLIAAAGNCQVSGCKVAYPAAYPNVLAVAATTYGDLPAYFSAYGPQNDIAAPGGGSGPSILSTWSTIAASGCKDFRGNSRLRVVDERIYCPADGTSMAAAVVTGVAALVWSMDDDLSAADVRAILQETAAALDAAPEAIGAGRLDAAAAVRRAIPAQLQIDRSTINLTLPPGSPVQTVPLLLENPSLEPITWQISATTAVSWFGIGGPVQGVASYGAPARTSLSVWPSELVTGTQSGTLALTATRSDGRQLVQQIALNVTVAVPAPSYRLALPVVLTGSPGAPVWRQPGPAGRTVLALAGSASVGITLPFGVALQGQVVDDLRVHADGFVTLPAITGVTSLPNRCLADVTYPSIGVYGWWTDLDPGAAGSQVSTFQPDGNTFVVEYAGVPAVSGGYRVSFQIAIHRDGRIDLAYGSLPHDAAVPPQATVGVRARDGRFYNQVACVTSTTEVGDLPRAYEFITMQPEELF